MSALFDLLTANSNALLGELQTLLSNQRLSNTLQEIGELQAHDNSMQGPQIQNANETNLIGNLSVLFVAHDCKAREYLSQFLEQQVGSLYTADNGEDGLRLFERHRPQLVIAGIAMSVMNGLEMAEHIRAICPNVQIILFNDIDNWSYQESKLLTLLKLAGNKFLANPLNHDKLLEAIQFCLDQYDTISDWHMSASVFMTSPLAITIADTERNIISANPAFTGITGYSLEEVKNSNMIPSSSKHNIGLYSQIWDSINQDGRWSGEIWNRRKNGEILEWATIASIHDWRGNITNYVSVFSEINQRLFAEEKLHQITRYSNLSELRLFNKN